MNLRTVSLYQTFANYGELGVCPAILVPQPQSRNEERDDAFCKQPHLKFVDGAIKVMNDHDLDHDS